MMPTGRTSAVPLSIHSIHKSYGAHAVLNNISLSVNEGEIFGLVGLNGAGKTTLIKIMLDLAKADSGQVIWFGRPASDIKARYFLSYLPEKFHPSRYLTGMEYLTLVNAYYQKPLDQSKMEHMARVLDLDPDVLGRRVSHYSKGMAQKLGLLGALLPDVPFLLLDEPMSGLDPRARIRLKEALLAAKGQGKAIFFSSHILSDLDEICDRIAIIHDSTIRYTGTPQAFRQQYAADNLAVTLEKAFLCSIEAA